MTSCERRFLRHAAECTVFVYLEVSSLWFQRDVFHQFQGCSVKKRGGKLWITWSREVRPQRTDILRKIRKKLWIEANIPGLTTVWKQINISLSIKQWNTTLKIFYHQPQYKGLNNPSHISIRKKAEYYKNYKSYHYLDSPIIIIWKNIHKTVLYIYLFILVWGLFSDISRRRLAICFKNPRISMLSNINR